MAVGGGNHSANQSQGQGRNGEYEERVVVDTRPCYIRYSLRGLGVFAGGVCLVFGVLNAFFHPLSFWCILLGIFQAVIGFFVATTEAAGGSVVRVCYCVFLNRYPKCSDWMDRQPLWVKPIIYILVPLPGMIFCTTWWTFFGGGFVLCSGIAYAISLWSQQPPSSSTPSNTTTNHNPSSSQPSTNNIFPKHTVGNNFHHNPTPTSQPGQPTIIDIRQNDATFSAPKSKTGGTTSMNPLANLSTSRATPNNWDDGESGGRMYENISVISGQTRNTSTPTTAMEMSPGKNSNSFYSNVDLDGDGPVGGGTFPDNPFVSETRNKVTIVKHPNQRRGYDNDEDEHNC